MAKFKRIWGDFGRLNKKRLTMVIFAVVCLAMVGIYGVPAILDFAAVETSGSTDNWGLSFPIQGEQPIGNADSNTLKAYDAYFVGNSQNKVIYLTFDAGFENGNTNQILDVLKKQQVPAAFFLVGTYIKEHPDLVKRMESEGHIVGNHTTHHPDMAKISDLASFRKELEDTEALYQEVTGKPMQKFYRPPQGKYNQQNLEFAQELGYKTFFWSLAYVDWYEDKQPSKDEAFAKLIPRIHNGSVVLLHSTSKTNATILDELLTKWQEMGFTFKTIKEIC